MAEKTLEKNTSGFKRWSKGSFCAHVDISYAITDIPKMDLL